MAEKGINHKPQTQLVKFLNSGRPSGLNEETLAGKEFAPGGIYHDHRFTNEAGEWVNVILVFLGKRGEKLQYVGWTDDYILAKDIIGRKSATPWGGWKKGQKDQELAKNLARYDHYHATRAGEIAYKKAMANSHVLGDFSEAQAAQAAAYQAALANE